jgi:hypothetical protein
MAVHGSLHSLLDYECLLFYCDEKQFTIKNFLPLKSPGLNKFSGGPNVDQDLKRFVILLFFVLFVATKRSSLLPSNGVLLFTALPWECVYRYPAMGNSVYGFIIPAFGPCLPIRYLANDHIAPNYMCMYVCICVYIGLYKRIKEWTCQNPYVVWRQHRLRWKSTPRSLVDVDTFRIYLPWRHISGDGYLNINCGENHIRIFLTCLSSLWT